MALAYSWLQRDDYAGFDGGMARHHSAATASRMRLRMAVARLIGRRFAGIRLRNIRMPMVVGMTGHHGVGIRRSGEPGREKEHREEGRRYEQRSRDESRDVDI